MATLSAPTIEELLINVRNMLNQPNASNSFWTDEELTAYLNEAVRRYFAEVVQKSEGQFTTQTDLDLTSGSATVNLPSDCFKVKNLWRKTSDGYEPLHYRNTLNEGMSSIQASSGSTFRPDYKFRKDTLVLSQIPGFNETGGLRLEYVQFPDTLVGGGDTLSTGVSPVFRDLIEAYAVWKAKAKESLVTGTDTAGVARQNLEDLFVAFKEAIDGRADSPQAIIPFNPEEY